MKLHKLIRPKGPMNNVNKIEVFVVQARRHPKIPIRYFRNAPGIPKKNHSPDTMKVVEDL